MAQDNEELLELTLNQLLSIEISVASKSDETVADAPSSVTVYTQNELRNMGVRTVQELLNFVPGFQSSRDVEQGRADRISARGKSSALSESVLFLVDGQRLNDLYTGGISILNRDIAVDNIKQIEIIRGPGSALYGSNAFMGVVNIVSAHNFNDAIIEIGSHDARGGSLNYSRDLGHMIVSAFVRTYSDDGSEYDDVYDIFGRGPNTRDPKESMDLATTLKVGNLHVNFRHMERQMEDFITFGAIANRTNQEKMQQSSLRLAYERNLGKGRTLEFSAGYSHDRWDTLALLIPKDLELFPGFSLTEHFIGGPYLESEQAFGGMDFTWSKGKHLLKSGLSFERARHTEVANQMSHHPIFLEYQGDITFFNDEASSFNRKETREITGFYLQDKIAFSEAVSATVGVRYDSYNDFGDSLNPRGALIYKANPRSTFKLMYGSAFRAPNFLELYDRNNPVDFGNPNLDAETVQTLEFAWHQSSDSFNSVVTLFRSDIDDTISLGDPVEDPENPLFAPTFYNGETVTTEGVELELKASLGKSWLLFGTYTHFFDGESLPVPESSGSLILNYGKKRVNVNLNGIWRGTQSMLPDQGSYFLWNLAGRYELSDALWFEGAVRNLADEDYLTQSLAFPWGVPNPGRTLSLSLSFQY